IDFSRNITTLGEYAYQDPSGQRDDRIDVSQPEKGESINHIPFRTTCNSHPSHWCILAKFVFSPLNESSAVCH
ncbi:MAG TPA: hypothetical protein PKJ77_08530, partial [Thermodesulfobacteriota bacterium]|nr:hypothetical protein [Thermodesulfobacteriota bacterium]